MNLFDYITRIQTSKPAHGITLYVDERKGTGYVHAAIAIEAGLSRTSPDSRGLPLVLSHLLDEGTKSRSRDALRLELEGLGSAVRFDISSEQLFVRIEGRSDVFSETMNLVSDMLLHSVFSEESLQNVVTRLVNEYEEDKEDTRKLAYASATRALLEDESSLRSLFPEEKIAAVKSISAEALHAYASQVLCGPIAIAVIGDVSSESAEAIVRTQFSEWNGAARTLPSLPVRTKAEVTESEFIEVPNKENVDVFLVAATDVHVESNDFVALSVANELLGSSGFTGHLMKTVRERDGLTYGIYSRLRDVSSRLPLLIAVSATFGTMLYERGLSQTKKEMKEWLTKSITKAALEKKKIEILGSYMVSLQDPEDVVWQIVSVLTSGRALKDIAEYPEKVRALTVKDVQDVANKYFDLKNFVLGVAGQREKATS